jgi:hypothetical protein
MEAAIRSLPIAQCTKLRQRRLCFNCLALKCTILSKFSCNWANSLSLALQLSNLPVIDKNANTQN